MSEEQATAIPDADDWFASNERRRWLAALNAQAREVFGDRALARQWLRTRALAKGGTSRVSLLERAELRWIFDRLEESRERLEN